MLYYKATLLKQMAKNCDILEFVIRGEREGSFIEKEVYERGGVTGTVTLFILWFCDVKLTCSYTVLC